MAVVNIYVQPTYLDPTTGRMLKIDPITLREQGANLRILQSIFAPAAGDSDGSIYRIFPEVPATYIPIWATLANDAFAGFTSASLGLYLPMRQGGTVKSANCFLSAQSLAAALTSNSPKTAIDALAALTLAKSGQTLTQIAGDTITNPLASYDICLLATTRGAATGNIVLTMAFAQA